MRQACFGAISALLLTVSAACSRVALAESASLATLRSRLQDNDIIFAQSSTRQSLAIRQATGSPWTHMGIVVVDGDKLRIVEAGMNGVAYASLDSFISRSRDRRIVVKRLKDEERLTPEARAGIRASLRSDLGKEYDRLFEWSDKKIYCSELVWRAYHRGAGISLGEVQRVRQLQYEEPAVRDLIKERYRLTGAQIEQSALLDEQIVTPSTMMSSDALVTVFDGTLRE